MKKKASKGFTIVLSTASLIFSLGAAFSGTAAWFVANSQATATGMSIQAMNDQGILTLTLEAGVGTQLDNGGTELKTKSGLKLTDASYDQENDNLYTNVDDEPSQFTQINVTKTDDTEKVNPCTAESSSSTLWANKFDGNVYYAVSWYITASYNFHASTHDAYLFFDKTISSATESTAKDTQSAFRLAIINVTDTAVTNAQRRKIVYAPNQKTEDSHYISKKDYTEDKNFTEYLDSNLTSLIASNTTGLDTKATDDLTEEQSSGRKDYLATLTKGDDAIGTARFCCIAWYEGTDPNVEIGKTFSSLNVTLGFYVTQRQG